MTLSSLNRYIIDNLSPKFGFGEAKATSRLILEDILDVTPTTLLVHGERTTEPETDERVRKIVGSILSGMPPQYATGTAQFMGMDFKVNPAVLIPRPETQELVDMIIDENSNITDLSVLDIGTGSGCIAIALARGLKFARVKGIDISEDALKVARENSSRLKTKVVFFEEDILNFSPENSPLYDIIVSNPPYIAESEKLEMESRVKDYEPPEALFVPDSDPLIFYRAIASFAKTALKHNGKLYFEINPRFAKELVGLLRKLGYEDIELQTDYRGVTRFAKAILKNPNL